MGSVVRSTLNTPGNGAKSGTEVAPVAALNKRAKWNSLNRRARLSRRSVPAFHSAQRTKPSWGRSACLSPGGGWDADCWALQVCARSSQAAVGSSWRKQWPRSAHRRDDSFPDHPSMMGLNGGERWLSLTARRFGAA